MTIDEKIQTKSFEMGLPYRVITVSDAEDLVHEALEKQREICAKEYMSVPRAEINVIEYLIKNAPEPEL